MRAVTGDCKGGIVAWRLFSFSEHFRPARFRFWFGMRGRAVFSQVSWMWIFYLTIMAEGFLVRVTCRKVAIAERGRSKV